MKNRILTGWTIQRGIYFALGMLIVVQSIIDKQWVAVIAGGYFASMGLFAFGCAAGNCFGSRCYSENEPTKKAVSQSKTSTTDKLY